MEQLSNNSAIVFDQVGFSRGNVEIFNHLSLKIPRGKVTAIMGPSGTGKTTLLRFIVGLIKPDVGDILVDGQNIAALSRKKLNRLRRSMGMLFQEGALFSDLTVFENVAFLLREHTRLTESMVRDLVLLKLEAVGLRGTEHMHVSALSGGMARRVALARAIMMDPKLMLYDEPFTGQDPINRGVLIQLIRQLNDALGLTSVVVSHDVHEVRQLADYLVVIANGCVIGQGEPTAVIHSSDAMLQQFMRGTADGPVPFRYPAVSISQDFL